MNEKQRLKKNENKSVRLAELSLRMVESIFLRFISVRPIQKRRRSVCKEALS